MPIKDLNQNREKNLKTIKTSLISQASSGLRGQLSGLCGNLNGVAEDDRATRASGLARGSADLWAGWRVAGSKDCHAAAASACSKDATQLALHYCRAIR